METQTLCAAMIPVLATKVLMGASGRDSIEFSIRYTYIEYLKREDPEAYDKFITWRKDTMKLSLTNAGEDKRAHIESVLEEKFD